MNNLWLAVDGHGREYGFSKEPWRDFPNLDLRVKWGQSWKSDPDSCMEKKVMFPKGTIEKLIGRTLSYSDDPVLIEFEDYGNYNETRPEVLNSEEEPEVITDAYYKSLYL
jgi:hypothetical protein